MKTPVIVLICLLFITISFRCLAQPNSWELILSETTGHINNDSRGNMYASSAGHILKSTDNGLNWDTIFTTGQYHRIFIDTNYTPTDRIILDHDIDFISTDCGENWELLNSPDHLFGYKFTSLGDILGRRWGTDYNIYRSTDNGITWDTSIVLPLPNYYDYLLQDLEVDIFDNIYMTIHYGYNNFPPNTFDEIYKSTDNGISWNLFYESGSGYQGATKIYTTVAGDLFIRDPNSYQTLHYLLNGNIHTYDLLAVSPWQKTNDHLYLLSAYYISRRNVLFSPDSGSSWQDITSGLPTGYLQHSNLCNDALGYLYINKDSLYKTTFTTERVFKESTIDFGDVKFYDTTHIQVVLQNPYDFAIQIDSVVSYNDQFFISDLQSNTIFVGDSITATIAFNPFDYDTTESYVYLHSELIIARIRVTGNSPYPVIGTVPASIFLFNKVPIDTTAEKTFKIFNNSSINNLIVDTVYLKNGNVYTIENINFPIVLETDDTTEFSISFHPAQPIVYWDTLTIHSNSKIGTKIIKISGEGTHPSSVEEDNQNILEFKLKQNYPNPFNPVTTIKYQIPESGYVTLEVYDVLGKEVATLVNDEKPVGSYEIEWNVSNLPSGIYFYQLKTGSYVQTKKMVFLK